MRRKFFILAILALQIVSGQEFISPVAHEIRLAGTFGELRSNHFHMGIDIKSSNRSSGDPIFAVEKGHISRVLVSRSGFGNAVYIDHPSGHTTIYGHLRNFSVKLDSLVSSIQEKRQSFEINEQFSVGEIPIIKGEQIGNMGNSGSSYGPHLHFEIRDTKTEVPINPIRFGFKLSDKTAPIIKNIKIYSLDDQYREIDSKTVSPTTIGNNAYRLSDQEIPAWRVGFGIQTYDPMNSGYNKNGIYEMTLSVDGEESYHFKFDSISYTNTRYLNAHIDYKHYKNTRARFHRCFKLKGNHLPMYEKEDKSIVELYQNKPREIEIHAVDFEGNHSKVAFKIKRDTSMYGVKPKVFNYHLSYKEPNVIQQNEIEIYFPDSCLYEDLFLYINKSESEYLTDVYHLGSDEVPLHKPITFSLKPDSVPENLKNKACIIECSEPGRIKTYGGRWEGNSFVCTLYEFGNYALFYDTLAPQITPLTSFTGSKIQFRIEDNYSDSGTAKGLQYFATIDGQWAKFEYDLKRNLLTYKVPPSLSNGTEHIMILKVSDDRGNTTEFSKKFFR
ncbi:M23 family metallopeptidase [Portibacter marinus]|uniref:M23 family metallopeptidase n=1 Tax=Portibacter marinus TaxID=2898660 RepID=UPI001F23DD56|nr:M23 family metallopeptidase [Portibacter marinus]